MLKNLIDIPNAKIIIPNVKDIKNALSEFENIIKRNSPNSLLKTGTKLKIEPNEIAQSPNLDKGKVDIINNIPATMKESDFFEAKNHMTPNKINEIRIDL